MAHKLPIVAIRLPTALKGQQNGKLDASLLRAIRPSGRLYVTAATSWDAMKRAAKTDKIILKPTSTFDAYRPLSVQSTVFYARYTKTAIPGASTRRHNGETWYLKPGNAPLASPGESNHGWGLAVDVASVTAEGRLEWLLANAQSFGFSWELQSEPWHLRYILGDALPPGVQP